MINSFEQQTGAQVKAPLVEKKDQLLSGRILDGLGRPVSGVKVEIMAPDQEEPLAVVMTGEAGRFSRSISGKFDNVQLKITKDDYVSESETLIVSLSKDFTLHRKIDWNETGLLPDREGAELDQGMRELLASEEDFESRGELLRFIFKHQATLRPAMRRLIKDPHVGGEAKRWLDKLGDPGDRDLFPEGRKCAPKHEIGEEDLVEAIKAISSRLNFFSNAPEPRIDIDTITFTPKMDRALIECGINMAPFTGVLWQFVFHKEGKRWVLRSMEEAGRG